jgi:hypothetical protein
MKTEAKTRDLFELARRTFFSGEKDVTSENKHPDCDEDEARPEPLFYQRDMG